MRRSVTRAAGATLLTIVTGIVINYATQWGPPWTKSAWVVASAVTVMVMLTIVAVVLERRADREPGPSAPAVVWLDSMRVPTLDVAVLGREPELKRLMDLVSRPGGRFAVVCGPGGTGKTALAAEVATRAQRSGVDVWWVRWRDPETFAAQLLEIAEALGLPNKRGRGLTDLVWGALTTRPRWLLVLDKVDQPQALSPTGECLAEYRGWVRAGGRGLLLITSRNTEAHTWGPSAEMIALEPLPIDDAASVLLADAPDAGDRAQARALAERLGGFPLAVRAAGRAIAQPTSRHPTFVTYRHALDDELGDILAVRHDGPLTEDQKRALLRYTWELSLDQLADEGHSLARPLLRVLSLAVDAPVPRDLITRDLLGPVVDGEISRGAVDGALTGLHRYGLVVKPPGDRTRFIPCVAVQHMVREINALLLGEESDLRPWHDTLDQIMLAQADAAVGTGPEGRDRVFVLAPHLVPILTRLVDDRDSLGAACATLDRVALACHESLDITAQLRHAIFDAMLAALGPEHPDTARSRAELAAAAAALEESQRAGL